MYKYFAFISFQSSDAKEALWVQKAIESYRLPTAISRSKDLPRRMRPCFCYLNDINLSEELMDELKLRMEQSEYLIVVCSPRSAKSTFVNGGIDYFVNLGRRDHIVPLIVEGIPYSGDPETECFPEALRRHFPKNADPMLDHQILGVNINEEGAGSKNWKRRRAVLMVIARMLNLEFDNLWNREVRRRRRQRITIATLIIAVLCMIALTWHFSRSVDVNINLSEQTFANANLPAAEDASLTLFLENETKTLDSLTITQQVTFSNIPRRFIGKQVRCTLTASGYLPVDTTITLATAQTLPISRDKALYGNISFRLRGIPHPENHQLVIAGHTLRPDADGNVRLTLPIEQQAQFYIVRLDGKALADTLFMPCGTDDVMLAN